MWHSERRRNMTLTPALLVAATGCGAEVSQTYAELLEMAMREYAIDTPQRRAHFVAQCAHQSKCFSRLEAAFDYTPEQLVAIFPFHFGIPPNVGHGQRNAVPFGRTEVHGPSQRDIANIVYAYRMGNGPTESGDGWRYRPRGLLPIMGKSNYRAFSMQDGKFPSASEPDILKQPEAAARSSAWFWFSRGCNELADWDDIKGIMDALHVETDTIYARHDMAQRAKAVLGA